MQEILGQPTATFRKVEPDTPSEVDFKEGNKRKQPLH